MQVMSDAAMKEIYELVKTLPVRKLRAAQVLLEELRDDDSGVHEAIEGADPFANMPEAERAELHAALEQSEREFAAGEDFAAEDVLRELEEQQAPR